MTKIKNETREAIREALIEMRDKAIRQRNRMQGDDFIAFFDGRADGLNDAIDFIMQLEKEN
jgi:hypothetical protein